MFQLLDRFFPSKLDRNGIAEPYRRVNYQQHDLFCQPSCSTFSADGNSQVQTEAIRHHYSCLASNGDWLCRPVMSFSTIKNGSLRKFSFHMMSLPNHLIKEKNVSEIRNKYRNTVSFGAAGNFTILFLLKHMGKQLLIFVVPDPVF